MREHGDVSQNDPGSRADHLELKSKDTPFPEPLGKIKECMWEQTNLKKDFVWERKTLSGKFNFLQRNRNLIAYEIRVGHIEVGKKKLRRKLRV